MVPHDKLVDIEKLKPKSKPLKYALKIPTKTVVNRKDLPVDWDEVFWFCDGDFTLINQYSPKDYLRIWAGVIYGSSNS